MKILVTGASGFVGGFFLRTVRNCTPIDQGRNIDIRNAEEVQSAISQIMPDGVVHLAAQTFVPQSFVDARGTFEVNFLGTLNLLSALKSVGFSGRLLFVSSGEVYGNVPPERLPVVEQELLKPRNPYAVSKMAAEGLCYQWSQTEKFQIVMTRSFNHIGPGQSDRFVVSNFAKQIVEIKKRNRHPILQVGDIDVSRDFLDVRDVVRAYQQLLECGANGESYNVCSGVERTVREILERLLQLSNVEVTVQQEQDRFRRSEQKRMVGSAEKLKKQIPWKPQFDLQDSLKDILKAWEQTLK
ncbi:MAG TPA: GDP-mannose 4,6-dehydratase [Terriglobales bacterium]|nr:GDP-mannose 4,6-dehydratase [Terriglobales bacterium]